MVALHADKPIDTATLRMRHENGISCFFKNRCQSIRIDFDKHEVLVNEKAVELTLKEYDLLSLLVSHPGIVFTREQLLNEIWGTEYDGETRTIDVHVRTLRQKLGEEGKHIDTVRGVGYRFREDV